MDDLRTVGRALAGPRRHGHSLFAERPAGDDRLPGGRSAIDAATRIAAIGALAQLHGEGLTLLLVEQNAQAALEIANRGYVLEAGQLTLEGPAQELLANPSLRAAYLGEA